MKTTDTKPSRPNTSDANEALDRLVNREEVLQICFWFNGEGLGDVYTAMTIAPFINFPESEIENALKELVAEGHLKIVTEPRPGYAFSEKGKTQAGRLFADTFSDYTRQGHGECPAGCCDGDDHSQCGDDCRLH